VNEKNPDYQKFIFGGENSVVRRWLRAGADGWRLDVADELPDEFVAGIHQAVRETDPNAIVIGEVWEDGTTKIAYNVRRKHLLGGHLDGLMNYPFRTAAIAYLLGGPAEEFKEEMETLRENYPPFAFYSAMNSLGTHDTARILTYLGVGDLKQDESRAWRASYQMPIPQRNRGVRRLKLGASILFTFPGSPTVYYGDEVGMEGFEDPFNRQTYPWGWEIHELQDHFRTLGQLRKHRPSLRKGSIRWETCKGSVLSYTRQWEEEITTLAVNSGSEKALVTLPWKGKTAVDLLTGRGFPAGNGSVEIELNGEESVLLSFGERK
jgi:glycosidase